MGTLHRLRTAAGDCYEANGRLFMDMAVIRGDESLRLVHGEVTGQGPLEGVKYGHAWIEDRGTVIDHSDGRSIEMPKDLYYKIGRIADNVHKYNVKQFRKKVLQTGHWGPWDLKTSTGM